MTRLSDTGDIIAMWVLLLVIAIAWLLLRRRLDESAATRRRKRADKGKVKCYHSEVEGGSGKTIKCKNKAGWVTPRGYFCDEHWEINSKRDSDYGRIRWSNQLAWKRNGG